MTPAQVDRLIAALERLGAASEQWNRQQAAQYAEGQAQIEEIKADALSRRRMVPDFGGPGPYTG